MILKRTRTVGTKLRRAREWRGISLGKVADSTKLSVAVLKALERDDISHLPGGVVGRGFVRSFAAAVKLDPEVMVAEFVAQFPRHSVIDGYPSATVVEPLVPPFGSPDQDPSIERVHAAAPRSGWSSPGRLRYLLCVGHEEALVVVERDSTLGCLGSGNSRSVFAQSRGDEHERSGAAFAHGFAVPAAPSTARAAVRPDPSPANDTSSAAATQKGEKVTRAKSSTNR